MDEILICGRHYTNLDEIPDATSRERIDSLRPIFLALDSASSLQQDENPLLDERLKNWQTMLGEESTLIECLVENLIQLQAEEVELAASILWVLVRLCRLRLDKYSAHLDNIQCIGVRALEILHCSVCQSLPSQKVAHPFFYLVMILASDNDDLQQVLVRGNVQSIIIKAMIQFSEHNSTLQFALRALRNVAVSDETSYLIVETDVCEHIIDTLNRFASIVVLASQQPHEHPSSDSNISATTTNSQDALTTDMHVLDCALWATVNLVCEDSFSEKFCVSGGVDALNSVLLATLGSPASLERERVLRAALQLIKNISSCRKSIKYCLGTIPSMLDALSKLDTYSTESKVPESILWAIANCCLDTDAGRQISRKGAGTRVIFGALAAVHQLDLKEFVEKKIAALPPPPPSPSESVESIFPPEPQPTPRDFKHSITGPVAESTLWCIRNLATLGTRFRTALVSEGAMRLVYELLSEYMHRGGMALLCFDVLLCLVAPMDEDIEAIEKDKKALQLGENLKAPLNFSALVELGTVHRGGAMFFAPEHLSREPFPDLMRTILENYQADIDVILCDSEELHECALKLLLAQVKYTNAITPMTERSKQFVRFVGKSMDLHPAVAIIARLGCEVLAALHYGIFSTNSKLLSLPTDITEVTRATYAPGPEYPEEVRAWMPIANGPGLIELTKRGLLVNGEVVLGGKTMSEVLHLWLPTFYPKPSPEEDEEDDNDEENPNI